ncbi:MAG: ribosome maturation factor [Sulfurimonas sp. RIFOXYD12_FULL_33_39]|uniref:ribosome maturation factor n=1 Tax=unclassified Sulfurimonas TaxID=2623549 RepID=UPI0008BE1662|nr:MULTISPECIES: ribosome maturation factor [unclassified Sulfurimonas]OHE10654.1 MAG: ribosome maturation factor [Sulfurimonas sp. RIFOXYD12_FULL_33_39]OHE13167.1 MAG: ribosome maturation factor [Sulfurimonas sp. RIFOXYD2_FULL_34_21]DAB27491.1 MAG TPA: ribosome maturation factor [Sulfurimonas sp. UBA10385]
MSLEKDIESFVKSVDLELYDISVVRDGEDTIYRVSVLSSVMEDEKRRGVSLDECVNLTHLISPLLDVTPPVSGDYRLEVGSPGIERKISSLKQFELSIGEKVALNLKTKDKIRGKLLKVEDSKILLDVEGEEIGVDFSQISKAKTYFEW